MCFYFYWMEKTVDLKHREKTSFYSNYYQRVIDKKTNGVKLVLGGTGLGKTSGVASVILNHSKEDDRKFVYVANRVQLLEELKEKIGEQGSVHLRSNFDILRELDLLPLLLDEPLVKTYYGYLRAKGFVKASFHSFVSEYQSITKLVESGFEDRGYIENKISRIFSCFRNILKKAHKNSSDSNISGNIYGFTQNDYDELVNHPKIISLFPFLEYKNNPEKKLLLITVQKAFKGFFDGVKNINLSHFKKENGNRIFILDEFDFLENDLLQLICDEPDIEYPFKFVAAFYNAMAINKLPSDNYLNDSPEIKKRIEKIIEGIDYLDREHGIRFPDIIHFVCTNDKVKGKAIFQTNYTIVESKLYLNDENRTNSFDLTFDETSLKAFILFDVVKNSATNIINLFNDLEEKNPLLYNELLRHCFETSDTFKKMVKSIHVYPKVGKEVTTNYEYLQYNGFSLYEIMEFTNAQADTEEVRFKYYSIHQTPEKILLNLAKNNLVFGLSATGEIPRLVKNFDTNWLKKQLEENFFETEDADIEEINNANEAKVKKRNNNIHFDISNYFEFEDYQNFVEIFAAPGCLDEDGQDIFKNNNKYCKDRLKHFLSTLAWIAENKTEEEKQKDTHLLFFSSFRQILAFFKTCDEVHDDGLFSFKSIPNNNYKLQGFEITVKGTSSIVVFYNAEQAKIIQKDKETRDFYNSLFWKGKPVALVTTFNSAGNGVNLQHYSSEEGYNNQDINDLKDFKNIHLLDAPFFYFSSIEKENKGNENSTIKQNIYYLSKLEKTNFITINQFKQHLSRIRKCGDYNKDYLESTEDGLFSQLSVFIQALGRIERVWNPMEDQTIRMSDGVYKVFETFFKLDDRAFSKQRVSQYFSNNIAQLFKLIENQYIKTQSDISDKKEERLKILDEECKVFISTKLQQLNLLRNGSLSKEKANELRMEWERIRYISLQHNFNDPIAKENSCVFTTPYYKNGNLNINKDGDIIPFHLTDSGFKHWDLDAIYRIIRENETIRRYFRIRGFQLGFDNHQKFFVPYFYQAILSGAIGEEAIKAILIDHSISLDDSEIPDSLFELADSKIKNKPWFIDFKNYGQRTIKNFPLPPDDPYHHLKLNEGKFKRLTKKKWKNIKEYYQSDDCKLIYLNLLGEEESLVRYFDQEFNQVGNSFSEAKIIVVPAVISREGVDSGYNQLAEGFRTFITQLPKI